MKNLFGDLPTQLDSELVDTLAANEHVRIERIISTGQRSPDGFWYNQAENEWVVVLKGEAVLTFEGGGSLTMRSGDHVLIPARKKHRVESTSLDEQTIWLAVFYRN